MRVFSGRNSEIIGVRILFEMITNIIYYQGSVTVRR